MSSSSSASVVTAFPKHSRNSIPTLPSEIIEEIIPRLSVRSLIISSSVCKSWYALLKSPYFATKHFQHATANTYFLLHCRQFGSPNFGTVSLVSSTGSFDTIPTNIFNNIPFLRKSSLGLRISGCCNGLVCLSEERRASIIILWNPITSVFKALPVSTVQRPDRIHPRVILGFGFDAVANDFKLLRIVYYGFYEHYQVDIYSLSSNCWREIQPPQGFVIYENSARMVVLKGRFHWKAFEIDTELKGELIATFDVSNEVFNHINLPYLFDDELAWELVVWKEDSLGLIVYPAFGRSRYFDMWVLDEYGIEKSWTKLFTFGQDTDIHKPLACQSNGEILLYNYNEQLVVYDSAKRTFKIVPVQGIPFGGQVFNYVGSLLPLEGGSTIEEANLAAVRPDRFFR